MVDGVRSSLVCIVLSDSEFKPDPKKAKGRKGKSRQSSEKKTDKPASGKQDPFDFDKLDGVF